MNELPKFLEKAKETYAFHRSKLLSNDKWSTTQTAKCLRRSIGSISEDCIIARACREYEEEIKKFKYAYEALEWIREKAKEKEREEV